MQCALFRSVGRRGDASRTSGFHARGEAGVVISRLRSGRGEDRWCRRGKRRRRRYRLLFEDPSSSMGEIAIVLLLRGFLRAGV